MWCGSTPTTCRTAPIACASGSPARSLDELGIVDRGGAIGAGRSRERVLAAGAAIGRQGDDLVPVTLVLEDEAHRALLRLDLVGERSLAEAHVVLLADDDRSARQRID